MNPPERQGKTVAFITPRQKSRRTRRPHRESMGGLLIPTNGSHLILDVTCDAVLSPCCECHTP